MRSYSRVLACDLDGTLLPPPPVDGSASIAAFRSAVEASRGLLVVYVTGRHLSFALEGVRSAGLPLPDVLVCDVGTSLHRRVQGDFVPDPDYAAAMRSAMGGRTGDDAREALGRVDGLELQEASKQAEFKASYHFEPERGEEIGRRVARALAEAGVEANVVRSRDVEDGRGLLDALPPGVAKDHALRWLVRTVDLGEDDVTYAGDSGNDTAALLAGFRGVLVGNARRELADELRAAAEARGLLARLYFARQPYAEGVLEGCRHFGTL